MADAEVKAADGEIPPRKLAMVVGASSLGTVFEWYDFFIFGTLTVIITKKFFAGIDDTAAFIFALLTFAVGFFMRPFGALIFGRIGDSVGRKGAFLITITMMGVATFAIGLLPDYQTIGFAAPVLLILCRMIQGVALGGEYGGAAIYVAEHAPAHRRAMSTSWIQTSAAVGLMAALAVILATRTIMGEEKFADWGWRVPFMVSLLLLGVSLWIRLRLEESPSFAKIKAEGTQSKAPLLESFLVWKNLKFVLIALFGVMLAQGVVWYTGYFYAQIFLERVLKVAPVTVNLLLILSVPVSALMYVFFGWLADRIGRKPVMLFGMVLMLAAYFPGFQIMTKAANPALAEAQAAAPVVVTADPATCALQFDPVGKAVFRSSCDIAKAALTQSGVSYDNVHAPAGTLASVKVGDVVVDSVRGQGLSKDELKAARADFDARLKTALTAAGYPEQADPTRVDMVTLFFVMIVFFVAATALYGPQAAALVELFPTRIRYSALSLPYHIGTGWFGGFLPATAFAIQAAYGNIYAGLWYPVIGTIIAILVTLFLFPETKGRDIDA